MSKHSDRAVELFKQGFNCSQAVFAAFADEYEMDEKTALKASAGLGGGVGRLREVCGALSGAAMAAGMVYGATEGSRQDQKAMTYKIVQQIADEFKKQNGSLICRDMLKLMAQEKQSYVPEERTDEFYKKRPCLKIIESTAKIADKIIFNVEE